MDADLTNINSSTSLAGDLVATYMRDKMLSLSETDLVFYPLGDKEPLPEGNGKTIEFIRYERLPLPNAPLSEGAPPVATPLVLSKVQAVVEQWGAICSFTDVGMMTV